MQAWTRTQRLVTVTLLALLINGAWLDRSWAYDGPVIDMHLHAWPLGEDGPPAAPKNQVAMRETLQQLDKFNIVLAATSGPEAFLTEWSAEDTDRLLLGPVFPCIKGLNPTWYQYECFAAGGDFPDLSWLEEKYSSGEYGLMGELYNQYAGIPYDDSRMMPYYALAERLGIPVAIHTHSAPPLTAHRCCPAFRIRNGNPLLVEDVLARCITEGLVGGEELVQTTVKEATKGIRGWFFCLAFVSIGLDSRFSDLKQHLHGGKPLVLYLCGQSLNLFLTLAMAYLMFGVIFADYIREMLAK